MRTIDDLSDLVALVNDEPELYVRYSRGYEADRGSGSLDLESGLELPGLSVNPLRVEAWWTRPLEDWLARQLCQYKHLGEAKGRFAWVLAGDSVGRGPDCEPLIANPRPIARLSERVLDQAEAVYRARFDAGRGPENADGGDSGRSRTGR